MQAKDYHTQYQNTTNVSKTIGNAFKQIAAETQQSNTIQSKPNYQREPVVGGISKIRKASGHRHMVIQNELMDQLAPGFKLAQSKEGIHRKGSNVMQQHHTLKTSLGFSSSGEMTGSSGTLGVSSSSKIKAKRNSKLQMTQNLQNPCAAMMALRNNSQIPIFNNGAFDDYQQQLSSQKMLMPQRYEKRRNIKSSNTTTNQNFYQQQRSSTSGYHETDETINNDDGDQYYFNNAFDHNPRGDDDDSKVVDYDDTCQKSYLKKQFKPLQVEDFEGGRFELEKQHDYQDEYRDMEPEFKIPAFFGKGSSESADKGQFYMTQILSQNQNKSGNPSIEKQSKVGVVNSGSIKIKNRTTNLKSSTKKTPQVGNPQIQKSYVSAQIKNPSAQQTTFGDVQYLADQLNLHNFNQMADKPNQGVSRVPGTSAQKRASLANAPSNLMNASNTMLIKNKSIEQPGSRGPKDFFNSTAPVNMNKIMYQRMLEEQPAIFGVPKFNGESVNSTQNLKLNQEGPFSTSYYSGVLTGQKTLKQGSQKQSMSPAKIGMKKQMLIQSILNQDAPSVCKTVSSIKQSGNGKYFLNLTLQQLIQNQHIKAETGELMQQAVSQKAIQKRLNKTLDNLKEQALNHNGSAHYELLQQNLQKVNKINSNYSNQVSIGEGRGDKGSRKPSQNNYSNSKQVSQKNKFSSTMRVQDFNQTQQFDKGSYAPIAASGIQPQTQNYMGNPESMMMGRKSKNSLKSTQNLNLLQINNMIQQDDKKVSALSIYSTNVAQSTTNYQQLKSAKKSSSKQNIQSSNLVGVKGPLAKQHVSHHRKQSSQGDNEKEMLKKMMNFYQDDFLNQFNVKKAGGTQLLNNNRMSMNMMSSGGLVSGNQKTMSYSASKSQQKNMVNTNKHKAHSTLNQYLLQQQSSTQPNKATTAMNLHQNPVMMFTEPLLVTTTNTALRQRVDLHSDEEQDSQLLVINPYNHLRQSNRKNSSGGIQTGKQQMFLKKDSHNVKDFQNKTQPIPKSILEIAAQIGTQAPNLSTGTSIVGGVNAGQRSKDSRYSNVFHQQAAIKSKSSSKGRLASNNIQVSGLTSLARVASQPSQPKYTKDSQVIVAPPPQLIEIVQDDPSEVYKNKKTHILDDGMVRNQRPLEQSNNDDDIGEDEDNERVNETDDSESSDGNARLNRFILGKQIGQGAYAVVRVATLKKDNKKYAIKVYDKSKLTDSNRQRSVRREIKLLQKMSHENIVKIYEAFETDEHVYLVMEYVGGGSLHSYLKEKANRRLEEDDAKRIFKQIMTALQYCHRKSIAHRDIKLENILLDEENNVKLIDFGFSTCIPNDKKIKMFCGTPSYMGPEIVMKEEYAGPPADIWASAVLLYALMNGCFPFRGATDKELYRRIQRGTFVLHNQNVSDCFLQLLSRMLNIIADERPTAEDVLNDEWFKIESKGESIADQKRLFKAKILGKIPVEKTKNTICLNSSNEQMKNIIRGTNAANTALQANIANGSTVSGGNTQQINPANTNNEFSDYGMQQQNIIKKLNQEAYQAYYNTSGGNFGMSGSGTIQNPYYNNFFQTNFIPNQQNTGSNANSGNQPNVFQNFHMKNSPLKQQTTANGQQSNPQLQGGFPFSHQPSNSNGQTLPPNSQGTPQVFGSPTAFHCNGGLINNNFNIINNIIMNQGQQQASQPNPNFNNAYGDTFSYGGATSGAYLQPGQQPANNIDQPLSPLIIEQTNIAQANAEFNDLDDDIVDSIEKLGFNRSQIVTQLLSGENSQPNHIEKLYTRLKEEKLSKTSKQNRALSMQPERRAGTGSHNFAVFPNFVPSIPEDSSLKFEANQIYCDDAPSDDYNTMVITHQKSPTGQFYPLIERKNQPMQPLFSFQGNLQ